MHPGLPGRACRRGTGRPDLGSRALRCWPGCWNSRRYRKVLYSPDAFGLPELCYLGAALFHRALSCFLAAGLQEDLHAERTLARLTGMFCAGDARRACRLGGQR